MIDFLHDKYHDRYNGHWYDNSWVYKYFHNWDDIIQARKLVSMFNIKQSSYIAAESMATLNHFAKGSLSEVQDEIYHVKRMLTKYLYLHYPTDVQLLKQTLVCKSCNGTGEYEKFDYYHEGTHFEECYKCNGTGTYRTVEIMAFTFHIGGQTIAWHQPRGLVDFDVFIPNQVGEYQGEKPRNYDASTKPIFLLDYLTVWEFLWRVGYVDSRITLLRALRVDLSRIRHNLPRVLKWKWVEFVDWLIGDNGDYYPPYTIRAAWEQDDYEDGIPF